MKDAKGHGSDGRGGSLAPRAQNELDFARRVPKPGHEAAFAAENKATSDASTAAARSAFASMHDDLSHTGAEHVAALGDAHGLPMQHGQGGTIWTNRIASDPTFVRDPLTGEDTKRRN